MAHVVIMPKQGQSVESCIVSEFKKKVGDSVSKGDILFGYETDKATFEEEAKVDGTVLAIFYKDGDEIPVLSNVMVIGAPGESFAEFAPTAAAKPSEVTPMVPEDAPLTANKADNDVNGAITSTIESGTAPISPRARALAVKLGVNAAVLRGSGPGGRVIERDIKAAVNCPVSGLARELISEGGFIAPQRGSGLAGTIKAADLKPAAEEAPDEYEVVKMSNIRKLIAKSMHASLQNSAQLTHMLGADATVLQKLRARAKKALEEGRTDANITINDLVCMAVIKALKKFPEVNSHCLGDSLRIFKTVNLGLAVDTPRGLMVPALKGADQMDIESLSKALKALADDCRSGSVNPDLLSSEAASFTVSNLGGFGVEWFTPILNVPQSAILGVGTMVLRPVLKDGQVSFVPYMGLSLTYDHRAIDGGLATRFLKQLAAEIENLELDI
ncbi:MAG: 2-oxo acid dehydrogenase subunit E2 [Bacteroidales bacterium]|nr:2-oxo acid dehydrogenase subunit E2 [Bacteroidales bacterium]